MNMVHCRVSGSIPYYLMTSSAPAPRGSRCAAFTTSRAYGISVASIPGLVDAINAFNSIYRQEALHNISVICPPLAQVLSNTYQAPVRCVIQGSGEVSSSEGTTQGDPLATAMYALAVRSLIDRLYSHLVPP